MARLMKGGLKVRNFNMDDSPSYEPLLQKFSNMDGKTNKWARKITSFFGKSQKNKKVESIYQVEDRYEMTLLMGKNSAAMGWATYMD